MGLALGQLVVRLANLGQRVCARDRNLSSPSATIPGDLADELDARDGVRALAADSQALHGATIDDRVDALHADAQLDREVDVAVPEGVEERVDAAARRLADPIRLALCRADLAPGCATTCGCAGSPSRSRGAGAQRQLHGD